MEPNSASTTSDDRVSSQATPSNPRWRRVRAWGAGILLLASLALSALFLLTRPSPVELKATVDLYLQAEIEAVKQGDGERFRALQTDDPAWLATQFQLMAEMRQAENIRLLHAEQRGADVWADIGWRAAATEQRRLIFYRWDEGRLRRSPSDPAYWGRRIARSTSWGELHLHRVDRHWADAIDAFVADQIADLCDAACRSSQLPLTVIVASDFQTDWKSPVVQLPSPRLTDLTMAEMPGPRFWADLRGRLQTRLAPVAIRFAVPDDLVPAMARAARDYTVENQDVRVQIVPFSALPADPAARLQAVDGAYMMPTVALITSGAVRDLTPFMEADPVLDAGDFSPGLLAAMTWQDRLWALPQSAHLRLVYYDQALFQAAALSPVGYLGSLWSEEAGQGSAMQQQPARPTAERWGLLDGSRDILYAYTAAHGCPALIDGACDEPGRIEALSAALTWYNTQVANGNMPDLSALSEEERAFHVLNWLSQPRAALLWLDLPGFYEHYDQLGTVGSFPLSAVGPNVVTPLHVDAGIISQASHDPQAVWRWLNYLSRQRPIGIARNIPARHSVADETAYWAMLPAALQEPMVAAFRTAVPIGIEAQGYFSWTTLGELRAGDGDAMKMAQAMLEPTWFHAE